MGSGLGDGDRRAVGGEVRKDVISSVSRTSAVFITKYGARDGIAEGPDVSGKAVLGAGVNLDGSIEGGDVNSGRPEGVTLLKLGCLDGVDEG